MKNILDKNDKLTQALIRKAKNGDFSALEKLYDLVSSRIFLLAKMVCANDAWAVRNSELAFAPLWEKIKFGKDNSNFIEWLSENTVLVLLKYEKNKFTTTPASVHPQVNKYLQLSERILKLPFNERIAITFFFCLHNSINKISELFSVHTESTLNLFNSAFNILLPTDEDCSFLDEYSFKIASNQLSFSESQIIDNHISEHPECKGHIKELKELNDALKSLPLSETPPPAVYAIIKKIVSDIQKQELKLGSAQAKLPKNEKIEVNPSDSEAEGKRKKEKNIEQAIKRSWSRKKKSEGIPLKSFYERHKFFVIASPFLIIVLIIVLYLLTLENTTWQVENSLGSALIDGQRIQGAGLLQNENSLETLAGSKTKISSTLGSAATIGENSSIKIINNNIYFYKGSFLLSRKASESFNVLINETQIQNESAEYDYNLSGDTSKWILQTTKGRAPIIDKGILTIVPAGYKIFYKDSILSLPVTTDTRSNLSKYIEANKTANLDSVIAYSTILDAFTLWNLLQRVNPNIREKVYARLFNISTHKQDIKHDDIIKLDKEALDKWFNSINRQLTNYQK